MAPPSTALLGTLIGAEHFPEFSRGLTTDVGSMIFETNPIVKQFFSGKFAKKIVDYDGVIQYEKIDRISTRSNITAVDVGGEVGRTMGGPSRTRHLVFPEAPLFKGSADLTFEELKNFAATAERAGGGKPSIEFINDVTQTLADTQEDLQRRFTKWFTRGTLQMDNEESDTAVIADEADAYAPITRSFTLWGGNAAVGVTTWQPNPKNAPLTQTGLLQFQAKGSQTGYYAGLKRLGESGADPLESKYWFNEYALCNGPGDLAKQIRNMKQRMRQYPRFSAYKFPTMGLCDNQTIDQLLEFHRARTVAVGQVAQFQELDTNLYGDVETAWRLPIDGGGTIEVMVSPDLNFDTDDDIQTLRGVLMMPNINTMIKLNSWKRVEAIIKSMRLPWLTPVEDLNANAFALTDYYQPNIEVEHWKATWYMSYLFMAEELCFNGAMNGLVNVDISS